jgi:hypothetical protein
MSNFADPSKSMLWLDGDAFRAPVNTALPADIFASSLTGWEPFGGIQAGFTVERPREVTKYTIWNKKGIYRQRKGDEEPTISLRPVDLSVATALTLLTGGSIVSAAGGFEWIEGDEEFFSFILRVKDSTKEKAYYVRKGEMPNKPTETLNDEQLMGWDIQVTPLVPDDGSIALRPFTKLNPLV